MTIEKQHLIDSAESAIRQHPNQQIIAKLTITMDIALTTKAKFETAIRQLRGAKIEGCNFQVGISNLVEIVEPETKVVVETETIKTEDLVPDLPGIDLPKEPVSPLSE